MSRLVPQLVFTQVILTQKERLNIKLYEITPNMQVYELMGVDTEKEMDIVTRKVDRVFQVVRMGMMMMFLNGDKSWWRSGKLLLKGKLGDFFICSKFLSAQN